MGLWTEYILVQVYFSSLQSAETEDTKWNYKWSQWENWFRRHLQSVTYWLARCLQVPHHSLETRIGNTIRLGTHTRIPSQWLTDRCNRTRLDLKCGLWGEEALPAFGVWARAASAVEQKPHEGSVSQHRKQTHSVSTIIKQDDLCVLFGSGTVETAEEQDHWKAAHSFNL